MNVRFHEITSYTWNFQNFKCVITILMKCDIHFLGLPWEIFFAVTTDDLLHLQPLKNVKQRMQNSLNYSVFFVFVHWKLKLLNFLVDSVLNYRYAYVEIHFHPWFILFKKEKNFQPRKTCNKTLSFQELVARTAAGGLFAVCRVLFSLVVCKVRDVS